MSETYTPQPDDQHETPDTSERPETPERSRQRGKLASKVLDIVARRQALALNAKIDRMAAPERDLDNLITDDQEILGQSPRLGQEMREGTKDVMNTADGYLTRLRNKNPLSTTRDAYLSYRKDRIAIKVARLERLVTDNPNSRLNKRRRKELEMFRKRQKWREGQIDARAKKRTTRGEKVAGRITKRDEKFQEQIDKYIANKVEAMRRKEQRKQLKEAGFGKLSKVLSPVERARYLANLPAETKKRLTREAILAVREENIRKGKLDWLYEVDETKDTRKVGAYGRTIE